MIGTIDCDAKKLITHWEKTAFDGTVTEWNKTLLVFKCLRRITDKHAITYQVLYQYQITLVAQIFRCISQFQSSKTWINLKVTAGGGPGDIVASREFVLVSKEEYKGDTWVQV